MKIRNDGKSTIIFNGGRLDPKKVASFKGDAEKIGKILLSRYKFLTDLDNVEEVEVVEISSTKPEEAKEGSKKEAPKAKAGKGKKSKK